MQTSRIRKLCEVPGAVLAAPTSPSTAPPTVYDEEPVKWGVHPAGESRDAWVTDEQRTTLLLLVSGRFHVDLSVGFFTLENEGDNAMWGPGIDHCWQAEKDTVVITVRWPSVSET